MIRTIFALDFPRITPAFITTSTGSSIAGKSYITSSMTDSIIERNARAPVFIVRACSAIAVIASLVNLSSAPSSMNILRYCLSKEFWFARGRIQVEGA